MKNWGTGAFQIIDPVNHEVVHAENYAAHKSKWVEDVTKGEANYYNKKGLMFKVENTVVELGRYNDPENNDLNFSVYSHFNFAARDSKDGTPDDVSLKDLERVGQHVCHALEKKGYKFTVDHSEPHEDYHPWGGVIKIPQGKDMAAVYDDMVAVNQETAKAWRSYNRAIAATRKSAGLAHGFGQQGAQHSV